MLGFIIGLFAGGFLGVFVMCLCNVASRADNNIEQMDVPSPKKQTKNVREKPNEKNDKYNMKLLYPTVFIPRFA